MNKQELTDLLLEKYPHLDTALTKQNWYSYQEALEDLFEYVNEVVKTTLHKEVTSEGKTQ